MISTGFRCTVTDAELLTDAELWTSLIWRILIENRAIVDSIAIIIWDFAYQRGFDRESLPPFNLYPCSRFSETVYCFCVFEIIKNRGPWRNLRPDQVLKAFRCFSRLKTLIISSSRGSCGDPCRIFVHILFSEPFVKFHENRCDLAVSEKNGCYGARYGLEAASSKYPEQAEDQLRWYAIRACLQVFFHAFTVQFWGWMHSPMMLWHGWWLRIKQQEIVFEKSEVLKRSLLGFLITWVLLQIWVSIFGN